MLDPQFINPSNDGNTLVIASVSFLVVEKRIDLLIESLKELADSNQFETITWHHFGDGPLLETLKLMAAELLGDSLKVVFHGYTKTEALFEFYRTMLSIYF